MKKKAFILSSFEFQEKFNTEFKCLKFLEKSIWENGFRCGHCESGNVSKKNKTDGFFFCRDCKKRFNVRANTIFHRSKISLDEWLYCAYLLQTSRKGVSSLQVSKQLGITQKTAWFMLNRLREACKTGSSKMSGDVSSDETYFGGLSKNKHSGKKPKKKLQDKTMVQGVKADNQLKLFIVNTADKKTLQGNIAKTVEIESNITTDELILKKGILLPG